MNIVHEHTNNTNNHEITTPDNIVEDKCYIDVSSTNQRLTGTAIVLRKIENTQDIENCIFYFKGSLTKEITMFMNEYIFFFKKIQNLIDTKVEKKIVLNASIPNYNYKWSTSDILRYPIARIRLITEFSKVLNIEKEIESLKSNSINELQKALLYSKNIEILTKYFIKNHIKDPISYITTLVEGVAVYLILHGCHSKVKENIEQANYILKKQYSYTVIYAFNDDINDIKRTINIQER